MPWRMGTYGEFRSSDEFVDRGQTRFRQLKGGLGTLGLGTLLAQGQLQNDWFGRMPRTPSPQPVTLVATSKPKK